MATSQYSRGGGNVDRAVGLPFGVGLAEGEGSGLGAGDAGETATLPEPPARSLMSVQPPMATAATRATAPRAESSVRVRGLTPTD